jgi:hypothetical protein
MVTEVKSPQAHYPKPPAQLKAEKEAGQRVDAIREQQIATHMRTFGNPPTEVVSTVHANRPQKDNETPESITFAQVGGTLVMTVTAKELVFGPEEARGLQRAVVVAASTL